MSTLCYDKFHTYKTFVLTHLLQVKVHKNFPLSYPLPGMSLRGGTIFTVDIFTSNNFIKEILCRTAQPGQVYNPN